MRSNRFEEEEMLPRHAHARALDVDDDVRPARASRRASDEDERPRGKSRRGVDNDPDEDERPRGKSRRDLEDENEDEKPGRPSRKASRDVDEDERPRGKSKRPPEDEDELPERGSAKPQRSAWLTAGGGAFKHEDSWDAKLNVFDIRKYSDQFVEVRLVGNPFPALIHWVPVDPKNALRFKNKEVGPKENLHPYPFICPDYDHVNEISSGLTCPHCTKYDGYSRKEVTYYCNAFVCIPNHDGAEGTWSEDLYVLKLKLSVLIALREVIRLKKGQDPADPESGFSVIIKYNSKAKTATEYWNCQRGESMPLSKRQRQTISKQFVDFNAIFKPSDVKAENESLIRRKFVDLVAGDYEIEEDRSDRVSARRGAKDDDVEPDEAPRGRSRNAVEDEDERPARRGSRRDLDNDPDEDERPVRKSSRDLDDSDEKPRGKSRRNLDDDEDVGSSSRRSDSDEDGEDDGDEGVADEDIAPRRGSRKPAFEDEEPPRSRSRRDRDIDNDPDEDERPARRSARKFEDEDERPARRSARRDDYEDEDVSPRRNRR